MRYAGTIVMLAAAVLPLGCGNGGSDGTTTTPLQVYAAVVSMNPAGVVSTTVTVAIQENGVPVSDATVKINGSVIPYDDQSQTYLQVMAPGIDEGADVSLDITRGDTHITSTLTMPVEPTVTQPPLGSVVDVTWPVTVQWNALSPAPDLINIGVDRSATQSGEAWMSDDLPGTATTGDIPAYTLAAGLSNVVLQVWCTNHTSTLGTQATTDSTYAVTFVGSTIVDTQ